VRIFLYDLVVSIAGTLVLWQFGLASKIWPAHPMLATSGIIGICAIAVHQILSHEKANKRSIPTRQS
jgi:hypothetical protein